MKISQIAKQTGTSIRSLRHYEKKGLITASRLDNNYREFDHSIIEVIHTIQFYLNLGLTTDQIKDIIYCNDPENHEFSEKEEYCEDILQMYETKLDEVIRQKKALADAELRLKKQISLMKNHHDKRNKFDEAEY